MLPFTHTPATRRIAAILGAASLATLIALPASALDIGDLFDWIASDDNDSRKAASGAPVEAMLIQQTFVPEMLPPVEPVEPAHEIPLPATVEVTTVTVQAALTVIEPVRLVEVPEETGDEGAAPVPEPSAALLFGIGAFAISQKLRGRR